jgi:DNA replication protein DnaC
MKTFQDLLNDFKKNIENSEQYEKNIKEYEELKRKEEFLNRIELIKYKTPEKYQDARIETIDKRIVNFMKSDKLFCWIYGLCGTGKTYSLYAIKNNLLLNSYYEFKVIKEYSIDYGVKPEIIDAIDDFALSENDNRNKHLIDLYFGIIDYFIENNKKLYITSNISLQAWINKMTRFNDLTASRIASRMSNVTDVINLIGSDKRKDLK